MELHEPSSYSKVSPATPGQLFIRIVWRRCRTERFGSLRPITHATSLWAMANPQCTRTAFEDAGGLHSSADQGLRSGNVGLVTKLLLPFDLESGLPARTRAMIFDCISTDSSRDPLFSFSLRPGSPAALRCHCPHPWGGSANHVAVELDISSPLRNDGALFLTTHLSTTLFDFCPGSATNIPKCDPQPPVLRHVLSAFASRD
ncbi:hypothetical protein CC79DRAFT_903376 [Sarocladium strictum]